MPQPKLKIMRPPFYLDKVDELGMSFFLNSYIKFVIKVFKIMVDYNFKSYVLSKNFVQIFKDVHYVINFPKSEFCKMSLDLALSISYKMRVEYPNEWKEAERICNAYYKRVKRLKDRISEMLQNGNCLFLTFTFNNLCLQKTNSDTRRQKIRRFLNNYNTDYVANIDFGKKNGREHYHAVIQIDKVDSKLYNYGALSFKKIRSSKDYEKLAKYISKLTNHAIKETTKSNYIIYSRKKSKC